MLDEKRHPTESLNGDFDYLKPCSPTDRDRSDNKFTEPTGRFSNVTQTEIHRFSNVNSNRNSDFQTSTNAYPATQ